MKATNDDPLLNKSSKNVRQDHPSLKKFVIAPSLIPTF